MRGRSSASRWVRPLRELFFFVRGIAMFISPCSSAYVEHLHLMLGSRPKLGSLLTVTVPPIFPNASQQRCKLFVAGPLA
jgi:hypothetical protein